MLTVCTGTVCSSHPRSFFVVNGELVNEGRNPRSDTGLAHKEILFANDVNYQQRLNSESVLNLI